MKTETSTLLLAGPGVDHGRAPGGQFSGPSVTFNGRVVGRLRTVLGILLVVSVCFGMSTGVTSGEKLTVPSVVQQLNQQAEVFADCMNQAGIPTEMTSASTGSVTIMMVSISVNLGDLILWRQIDGSMTQISAIGPDDLSTDPPSEQELRFSYGFNTEAQLWVNGTDRTADYLACQRQTGYTEGNVTRTLMPSLLSRLQAYFQLYKNSNEQWYNCVRDSGWTDVTLGEYSSSPGYVVPAVYMPVSMSPSQLRSVLHSCPAENSQDDSALTQWRNSHNNDGTFPPGYLPDPLINFTMDIGPVFFHGDFFPPALDAYWARQRAVLVTVLYGSLNPG